ncbi:CPCC family cysteine-rich protein [Peptostreptococcus sp. D1]|uniref:CPCC family cysteine-rich protein n=1 Tax=Peptostreptococcus sp. D1 TaxID=72304 RepID=UPI0008EE43A8|nr:CPCC family cysteine-rich protein [Peptostreptococcus sp. D1]SFE96356.1 Cysteine-rich CPCC [Peptostreptococcus sp. D1]
MNKEIEKFPCPVCEKTIVEAWDICDECGWENTGILNIDGGPNKMTLEEAKKAYKNGEKVR